jgi:beta-galactosidase
VKLAGPRRNFSRRASYFAKYLLPGEKLPEPPAQNPMISFAPVAATEVAPIFDNLPAAIADETPRSMEQYDQGYGCILYRTKIPAGGATTLEAAAIHDFGFVFVDGKRIGVLDRRSGSAKISLPERQSAAQLDILVEPMGRINFGPEMLDPKGLIAPVKLGGEVLKGWQIFNLPLDGKILGGLKFASGKTSDPAFWRATVNIEKPGDTFLDLRSWGKGVVWVNGHCLGRFWNIGPSQTAYAPGCWLRAGANEVVILDYIGPEQAQIGGLEKPILDDLQPAKDFAKSHRPAVKLNLDSAKSAHTGTFAAGGDTQEIKFAAPATGKFFCLESLNAQDGKPYAAVAELDLLDASGNALSHNGWTIAYVDSEERTGEDGSAENAIDGQTANFWHTEWQSSSPAHPHRLILNLGKPQTISGFRYVPRQGTGGGRIKDYRIIIGDNLVQPK